MFFATYVLTQKGPLAKVWLAAHWDKKLTSKDVKVIDLKQTIVHVVQPSVPIALRTSGELMLGIVRIYALKVANLLKDATEATSVLLKPRAVNMVKIPINNKVDGSADQQQQKDGTNNNNQQQQFQNAVAITMDVTVNRIGADQLCDADFAEVADLLNDNNNNNNSKKSTNNAGGNNNNKNKQQQEDDANWWFATDASQAVEEVQYTSRHDAEMAKFRAELNKSSAANSKSTKGSSGSGSTGAGSSSVEQARGDNNADNNNNNNKQNAAAGEFVPPTAEQEKDFLMMGGADGTDTILNLDAVLDHAANNMQQQQPDGDDLPNFNNNNNAEEDAAAAASKSTKSSSKKLRMVIVLDAETSLKPEALKKMAENRSDIVNSERRHGPLDEGEVQDRTVLRDEAIVTDCSSLACYFNNDVLRAAFHSAVQAVATERISEIEKIRGGGNNNRASNKENSTSNTKKQNLTAEQQQQEQQHLQQPTFDDEDFSAMMNNNNNNFDDMNSAGRRRGRHADDENEQQQRDDSFSASTVATLKNLRENLLAAGAKSCSFRTMIHGMAKQSACRTFVDLLHLASHQFVGVAQKEPFGAITVSRGPKFASTAKQ